MLRFLPFPLLTGCALASAQPAAPERFVDVTARAGLEGPACTWAAGFADYDVDGDVDLYLTNHLQASFADKGVPLGSHLLRNEGGWSFSDVTEKAGLTSPTNDAHHVSWLDVDGDGCLDLFVAQGTPKTDPINLNVLHLGDCEGGFTKLEGQEAVAAVGYRTRGGLWFDPDRDGDPDFYGPGVSSIGGRRGKGSQLLEQTAPRRFTATERRWGLQRPKGQSFQAAAADFDRDGWTDLAISPTLALYRNQGGERFADESAARGIDQGLDVLSSSWADVDGDGDEDLLALVSNTVLKRGDKDAFRDRGLRLYLNDGTGNFSDGTEAAGLTGRGAPVGSAWGDVDNDGDVDLVVTMQVNRFPDRLYLNQGDGTFLEKGAELGIVDPARSGGSDLALVDLDGDGRLDLFIGRGYGGCKAGELGRVALYRNELSAGHWLAVDLVSPGRTALGTVVELSTAGGSQRRVFQGPHHFLSQDHLPLHLGLGSAEAVRSLVVTWPDGARQEVAVPGVDRVLRVERDVTDQRGATRKSEGAKP